MMRRREWPFYAAALGSDQRASTKRSIKDVCDEALTPSVIAEVTSHP